MGLNLSCLRLIVAITFLSAIVISCNKEEGEGGESTIKGRLVCRTYDKDYRVLQGESGDADEDVYIIYGDDSMAGDKVTTSPDGYFEFNYLQKGNYTLYYYSDDSTKISTNQVAFHKNISIGSDGNTVDVGNLLTYKGVDIDEGTVTIRGYVELTNYKSDLSLEPNVGPAQEQEVYLVYENHITDDIRVRTSFNGYYEFKNVLKGTYIIYAYTDDVLDVVPNDMVYKKVVVTEDNQLVEVATLKIDKK